MNKVLSRPPRIVQEPNQCWSAAYDCWSRANQLEFNVNSAGDGHQLANWFAQAGHNFTFRSGSATKSGREFIFNIGLMRTLKRNGSQISEQLLNRLLTDGYIYTVLITLVVEAVMLLSFTVLKTARY